MKKIILTSALSIVMGGVALAQITYVDAIADSSIGTVNTTGPAGWYNTNAANANLAIDNQWSRRTDPTWGNGVGEDILQARTATVGNAIPQITTTITGLTSGQYYRVYAFFWDATEGEAWTLDAGLATNSLQVYSGSNELNTVQMSADGWAGDLDLADTNLLVTSGNRSLLYADIGFLEVGADGEIDVYIDNTLSGNNNRRSWYDGVGYEAIDKPRNTIIWEDDFSGVYNGKHIEWHPGWTANAADGGWAGTNTGVMLQRPTISTNTGKGFGGGVRDEDPLQPDVDETMVVQFDWRMYTDGLVNNSFMDLVMATNVVMADPWHSQALSLTSTNTAMGFRVAFSSWPGPADGQATSNGTVTVIFADNTEATSTNFIDPAILGLAPTDGDNVTDTIAVTYSLEKTATTNIWVASLLLSNSTTSASDLTILNVTNSVWYNNQDFYFAQYANSFLTNGVAIGNEFDNFQGIIRGPAPPTGWDAFLAAYPVLSGNPYADYDGDGLQDVAEYGLDGVPTNAVDIGNEPYLEYGTDDNVRHYHYELSDPNRGISYTVEMTDDLVVDNWTAYTDAHPGWWNGSTSTTVNAKFDEVMYRFWGGSGAPDQNYIRLFITLDP